MKVELSADLAETVSCLLHEYQESVGYDEAFASYCGEVAKKFDDAVAKGKSDTVNSTGEISETSLNESERGQL
jgi:hypothetical protein